ncbi:MAG: nucleoside hydrolase [Limnochordaceae bacterium]|nr:nucleoside hydrolase [Limnochordaceae bacterium]
MTPAPGPTRLILDCDPGHDDMVALILAARHPSLRLEAVTTVAGNAPVRDTTRNALRILRAIGSRVPVYQGADRPLVRTQQTAQGFHGENGLASAGAELPPCDEAPAPGHAVEAIIRLVEASPGEITVVTTGPMTNLALALRLRPELARRVRRIAFMGGSTGAGNVTPAAEFNIWADAEAARIVLESGAPLAMFGLNVTHQARLTPAHVERVRRSGGRLCKPLADLLTFYLETSARHFGERELGAPLHDPCPVAYLARPELFEMQALPVQVVTDGGSAYGMTLCDTRVLPPERDDRKRNVEVAVRVNAAGFVELVLGALEGL